MPEFTNPSAVELSVLRGLYGCLWSNMIKSDRIPIAVLPLFKVPHVLASGAEDTILQILLHSVWIGQFILGVGFTGRG